MAKLLSQMSAEELLAEYNRYEEMLYSGGKDYQNIPDGIFENIKGWLARLGYRPSEPKQGLSKLVPVK